MSQHESPVVTRARSILLAGEVLPPEEALTLVRELKADLRFGYARKILECTRARFPDAPQAGLLAQQHALCTYKDPDQPTHLRLERARAILHDADDPASSRDQETLGLAGAIEKRMWELDSHPRHLERALGYYRRAAAEGVDRDLGYTAINAAFIHDLLTAQDQESAGAGGLPEEDERHIAGAARLRREIVQALTPLAESRPELATSWWFLTTLAEAHFGLGEYAAARDWLQRAVALENVPGWERESTGRQLARLALLQRGRLPLAAGVGPDDVLKVLLEGDGAVLDSLMLGKVGLALSGGGFRASLFHIGVLARLAELDVLRHVEVISCVSGGSILGAHYYLELRKLLESKSDSAITRDDYVDLVQRVASDFLAGVKRNIRMRVAAELTTNLKMIFLPHYSRTQRAGELYEREIYSKVKDGLGNDPRYMDQLLIQPRGAASSFEPKRDNWVRRAKVPILVLNATSLNSGHLWQFTATWMGEPPAVIDSDVDGNYRLRRMYYRQAPEPHQRVRLGHAVAASACVPGLFEPLALPNLYPDPTPDVPDPEPIVVRLVDGGVHDNQGISSLIEQECSTVLVSDASGQMSSQEVPGAGALSVPLRSNDILMARVREEQFQSLENRRRGSLLRRFMFLHLKRGLGAAPVDWQGCQEPYRIFGDVSPAADADWTDYSVPRAVQKRIAAIRTDLDSFSDAEAYALMASGYRMTERAVESALSDFPLSDAPRGEWPFLRIEPVWACATGKATFGSQALMRILDVAGSRFLKVWKLIPALRVLAAVLLVGILAGAVWSYFAYGSLTIGTTVGALLVTAGVFVAGAILGPVAKRVMKVFRYDNLLRRAAIGLVMALAGWLVARVHLHLFDRLYLWWGSDRRIIARQPRGWLRFTSILRRTPQEAEEKPSAVSAGERK